MPHNPKVKGYFVFGQKNVAGRRKRFRPLKYIDILDQDQAAQNRGSYSFKARTTIITKKCGYSNAHKSSKTVTPTVLVPE